MSTLTIESWLSEIQKLCAECPPDTGLSSREIAACLHLTENATRRWIRQAIDKGELACVGRKPARAIDGKSTVIPCYNIPASP